MSRDPLSPENKFSAGAEDPIYLDRGTKKCRVCLNVGQIPIFGSASLGLSDEVRSFGGIEIDDNDGFPQYLCKNCLASLKVAQLFRRTAQQSDRLLRKQREIIIQPDFLEEVLIKEEKGNSSIDIESENEPSEFDETPWKHPITLSSESDSETTVKRPEKVDNLKQNGLFKQTINSLQNVCFRISETIEQSQKNSKKITSKAEYVKKLAEFISKKKNAARLKTKIPSTPKIRLKSHENDNYNYDKCYWDAVKTEGEMKKENNEFNFVGKIDLSLERRPSRRRPCRDIICDICGKQFRTTAYFTRHYTVHNPEMPFKCPECPYRGRRKESLKQHLATHTGPKFMCTLCPARFVYRTNLFKHVKRHGPKQFACEECDKRFYFKRDLNEHIFGYHRGIRNHICDQCGTAFRFRKKLLVHMRNIHKVYIGKKKGLEKNKNEELDM